MKVSLLGGRVSRSRGMSIVVTVVISRSIPGVNAFPYAIPVISLSFLLFLYEKLGCITFKQI
ncbi:unnamed protein product, partial [Brassica oleracea]